MATYIKGVQDYIPQIQPFTPDFNFYTQAMRFKQNQHDAAREQLSNLYGSLLNAPMSRTDNIEARDKFFKTIKQDIAKLSGMDLSKQANVQQGQMLFGQLTDNNNIVKDMVWTKHYQNQMQKGQALKNCADPEKCGGSWWEGGDRYMAYKMQEFKNASAEDALKMGNVDYVAQQDVMTKAIKLAKDAGLSIEVDQLQGGYITTTKNGPLLQGPLSNLFTGTLAKDGKILEYYKTKSYVDRKDFAYSNAEKYGSFEAADKAYVQQNSEMLRNLYAKQVQQTTNKADINAKIKEEIATEVKSKGANPRSSVFNVYKEMTEEEDAYRSSSQVYKDSANESDLAYSNLSGAALDRSMAAYYLGNEINNAASTLAMKDYKFSMKADQYSLESFKMKNRLLMEDIQQKNRLDLAKYKFDLDMYEKQLESVGPSQYNTPTQVDVAGSVTGADATMMDDSNQSYSKLEAGADQYSKDYAKIQNDLSAPEKSILNQAYRATESAAMQGSTQAKADYVDMTLEYLSAQVGEDPRSGLEVKTAALGEEETNIPPEQQIQKRNAYAQTLASIRNASSIEQKFALAKKAGVNINAMTGYDADQMYMNTFEKFSATNADGENVRRPYLRQVNQMATANKESIKAKREYLAKMDEGYSTLANGVISQVKAGKGGYSQDMIDALDAYIDPTTGHARNYADFERAYMAKGYSAQQAQAIYRQDQEYGWSDSGPGSYVKAGLRNIYEAAEGAAIPAAAGFAAGGAGALATTVGAGLGGFGTGAAGTALAAGGPFSWGAALAAFGAVNLGYNLWEATFGDGDYGLIGFDFKSPGYYEGNRGAVGSSAETGGVGKGSPGLLSTYKRAFSQLADPPGEYGWMNVHGLGQKAVKGLNYANVDPQYPGSAGTMGTLGMIKNTMMSKNAKVQMGNFGNSVPEEVDKKALQILGLAYQDMINNPKGTTRLTPNITYSHIAGGDDNWVAMNMKFNDAFSKKFKGTKDEPGLTKGLSDQLKNEGITMYVPKAEANNIFTNNAERTSLDILMDYNNEITIDSEPKYFKGARITRGPNGYYQEGLYASGINQDGSFQWSNFQTPLPNNVDLTDAFNKLNNNLVVPVANQMRMLEKQWNLANGIKDVNAQ
jgi:hypothetical protein